jgi:hypothetical protein
MGPKIRGKITAGRSINVADSMVVVNIDQTAAQNGAAPAAAGEDVNIATRRATLSAKPTRSTAEILAALLGIED